VVVLAIASFRHALASNPPTPNPPGSFSIGIMGDAPYFLTRGDPVSARAAGFLDAA
jgi:hypothetical protein